MICDKDGIPELIQRLVYLQGTMMFEVLLFNGETLLLTAEHVCPYIDIMQLRPTKMQWLEAENNITKFALSNWAELRHSWEH